MFRSVGGVSVCTGRGFILIGLGSVGGGLGFGDTGGGHFLTSTKAKENKKEKIRLINPRYIILILNKTIKYNMCLKQICPSKYLTTRSKEFLLCNFSTFFQHMFPAA